MATTSTLNLDDAKWYWGDVLPDVLEEKITGSKDGTFAVRNASYRECGYTLAVSDAGKVLLFRISHVEGKYSIYKQRLFESLVELVLYYQHVPFGKNRALKLLHPLCKRHEEAQDNTIDKLKLHYKNINKELMEQKNKMDDCVSQYDRTKDYIKEKRQALKALKIALKMFDEQVTKQKDNIMHESQNIIKNKEMLVHRLMKLIKRKKELEDELLELVKSSHFVKQKIHSIQQDIAYLKSLLSQDEIKLTENGLTDLEITALKQDDYTGLSGYIEMLPHHNENNWLSKNCINRDIAENLLLGKPKGAFLVRRRKRIYVLSVMCEICFHCKIYHTNKGYGFSDPEAQVKSGPGIGNLLYEPIYFKSLKELVLHYAINSLEENNPDLNTLLTIPVFAI